MYTMGEGVLMYVDLIQQRKQASGQNKNKPKNKNKKNLHVCAAVACAAENLVTARPCTFEGLLVGVANLVHLEVGATVESLATTIDLTDKSLVLGVG